METVPSETTLAQLTTMAVGGKIKRFSQPEQEAELISQLQAADAAAEPVLVLGGGSNIVAADETFPGVVIKPSNRNLEIQADDSCSGVIIQAGAGLTFDDLVAFAVAHDAIGLEALSGIPGNVGAAPVQNIGAYGQEISNTISLVRTWDRERNRVRTLTLEELKFGYRTSILKESMSEAADPRWYPSPRYVVLSVTLQCRRGSLGTPIGYEQLAQRLGVNIGDRVDMKQVRQTVLELRGSKGMLVQDEAKPDADRNSAGSFFTNPIITKELSEKLPADAPRHTVRTTMPESTVSPSLGKIDPKTIKTSAAWLIEQAGFSKGFKLPGAKARLSTKHVLALTNPGGASAQEILDLAKTIQDGVYEKYQIWLEPEPILLNLRR